MSLKLSIQSFINNLNEEYQFKKQKDNYLELDEEDALIIGTSQFGDVAFDKKKLLSDTRCLIVGTSGSGKSYFTRNIIETIYNAQFKESDGSPVKNKIIQIHDPEGEFFTLRENCQFDFLVFGRGEDCDIEINADNAAEFAQKTLKYKINCIIDYTLIPEHKERLEISSAWNESLVAAPKELRSHLFLFIDEAHKFAQKANGDPLNIRSKISLKQLSQTGRKRGIVTFFITQRVTHLHTDITAECNNFLIGKTSIVTDIKRNGELTRITSPKQQNIFKMLRKEFIVSGESFVHSDDDKLASEIIKCTSNSPSSKHGKENLNINDPLFYEPSGKVEEWIRILKGQQIKTIEPKENSVHTIRELRLKKMEQQKINIQTNVDTQTCPPSTQQNLPQKLEWAPAKSDNHLPVEMFSELDKTNVEQLIDPIISIPMPAPVAPSIIPSIPSTNNIDINTETIDINHPQAIQVVNIEPMQPTTSVEKSLTNNFNTSSAAKIITENTFNVWFHIVSFFESITFQNLYVLSIRDDYNGMTADIEIKLFCKQNKDLFIIQGDSIWFMPKNPNDENQKSRLQLSKSDYFIKLWKHKLNNVDFENILMYLYEDENCNNSYEEISESTNISIKEIKKFVDKYSRCGLVKSIENCMYINTIFFHPKIHESKSITDEDDDSDDNDITNNEPDLDDPDFDNFEDDDSDFDDEFEEESSN